MNKKHTVGRAAAAAVLVVVPGGLVLKSQAATAERRSEQKSLEQAAEEVFQRSADAPDAAWRTYAPPRGKVWNQADARADMTEVEKNGAQFTVDVTEITTPYLSDKYGGGLEATAPYMGDHRFVFERDGDDWRLVKDLTEQLEK
ncbi:MULTISPECIES: hypothetical protein [unclassified Streptomyces]|uniref:hypothetical protein n=1 Tax=unclassified Streptomyces TaxID=2593676 RepID=UPI0034456149